MLMYKQMQTLNLVRPDKIARWNQTERDIKDYQRKYREKKKQEKKAPFVFEVRHIKN